MENEVRLIDANALQRRICKAKCNREYEDCRDEGDCEFDFFIFWAPTIDPETLRPKGRWANERILIGGLAEVWGYDCSVCGKTTEIQKYNYCPHCGARMEDFNG